MSKPEITPDYPFFDNTLKISANNIDILALGSAVLGSGGGGNPYLGALLFKQALEVRGLEGIEITPFDQPDEGDLLISSAGMGSPVIGIEKIPNGEEYAKAFIALEKHLKREAKYISPVEIGGVNSIVPLITACYRQLPVVDGDGEGRAFPELQMTTFNAYGQKASPLSVVDERGNTTIIDAVNNLWAEKIARAITVTFGGRGYVAIYPMNGEAYRKTAIPNSLSKAISIGEALIGGMKHKDAEDSLTRATGGKKIFRGKVVDLERYNVRGFSIGNVIIQGTDAYDGLKLKITFQNEYLRAKFLNEDGEAQVLAETPNIISIHDNSTMLPITTDQLRYGLRCTVFTIPVDTKWLNSQGLAVVGPKSFNLDDQ